ncbi:MAG: DUF2007 domain-containing protein [Rikenellaceae bacterium]|nr:DUF2007 domain-containing protein [Rikenellaceae bacterium]
MDVQNEAVVVATYLSVNEAQIFKALLESAGVPARMQNDIAAQIIPAYGDMMQVNLLVSPDDVEKAQEILSAGFDRKQFEAESENPTEDSDL